MNKSNRGLCAALAFVALIGCDSRNAVAPLATDTYAARTMETDTASSSNDGLGANDASVPTQVVQWQKFGTNNVSRVAIHWGTRWCIGQDGSVYIYQGGKWVTKGKPGGKSAHRIAADVNGNAWVVSVNYSVWSYGNGKWGRMPKVPGGAIDIASGNAGTFVVNSVGVVYMRTATGWVTVANNPAVKLNARQISVGKYVDILNSNGQAYRWNGFILATGAGRKGAWDRFFPQNGNFTAIGSGFDLSGLWVVNKNGSITYAYYSNGKLFYTNYTAVVKAVSVTSTGGGNQPWITDAKGAIYIPKV